MGGLDFLSGPTWFTISNLVSMEMKFRALTLKYQPTSELPGGLVKTQISGPLSQNSWCRRSGGVLRMCLSDVSPGDATGPQTTLWGVPDQTLRSVRSIWGWAWADGGVYRHGPLSPTGNPGQECMWVSTRPLQREVCGLQPCVIWNTCFVGSQSRG